MYLNYTIYRLSLSGSDLGCLARLGGYSEMSGFVEDLSYELHSRAKCFYGV